MARRKCPACGSTNVRRYVFGYPGEPLNESKFIAGGCLVSGRDPDFHCDKCDNDWQARPFGLDQARELATRAHHFQYDLVGDPYYLHLEAVAGALVDLDPEVQIAGWLHDIIEDTDYSAFDLWNLAVPDRSITIVEAVTRQSDQPYEAMIAGLAEGPVDAIYVKIADNAHNSEPHRVARLRALTGAEPNPRYAAARRVLYPAADPAVIGRILERVNPSLLAELER